MRSAVRVGFLIAACAVSFVGGMAAESRGWFAAAPEAARLDPVERDAPATTPATKKRTRRRGNWKPAREPAHPTIDEETAAQLTALGYLDGYEPARAPGGGRIHDRKRIYDGWTLFCSGHGPVVQLVDLDGSVVHEWAVRFEDVWPDGVPFRKKARHTEFLRRAHLFPNGDVLVLFDYIGIVKLDRDSNVIWKTAGQHHHDMTIAPDGSIVTLARKRIPARKAKQRFPGYKVPPGGVWDDHVVFLDSSGRELRRVSILEAFLTSDYASFLSNRLRHVEPFHANSVRVIDRDLPKLGIDAGQILISLRLVNAIVALDVEKKQIAWLLTGKWRGQHQASLLPNGNILLFDNLGGNKEAPFRRNQSEVLEVDPVSQAVRWRYGSTTESPLFTRFLGYVQRLPNGNTLVTESAQGRILEVAPDGAVVWEYLSPHRAGDENELVATILGAQRFPRGSLKFLRGR